MNASKKLKVFVPCLTVLTAAIAQAHAEEQTGTLATTEVTVKVIGFDASGGPGAQVHGGATTWSDDRDSGLLADLDIDLKLGDSLVLERKGFGPDNHRGSLKGQAAGIGFNGYYSHLRSNGHAVDYTTRPGSADNPVDPAYFTEVGHTNSGFLSRFSDDSPEKVNYHVERTAYGLAIKFKPELLGKGSSFSLAFDGYSRDGNKFATWVAGNGDFVNGAVPAINPADPNDTHIRTPQRWRGYEKPVDEDMGRISWSLSLAPADLFQLAYDGGYEKFNHKARTILIGDFAGLLDNGVTVSPGSVDMPLHFIPDSTLTTHAVRIAKNFGDTALAAGYGMSRLKQDSYLDDVSAGFDAADRFVGKISTENAYLNVSHRVSPAVSVEGHLKYYSRDNDSSMEADGLDRDIRDEWGVRIANIESMNYGLSAMFRGLPAKSTLTVGWKREDSDRDLKYNPISAPTNIGVWPSVSLYTDSTVSDEVYLKWLARPMPGMTLRVTPSYTWANKTTLVTLPEKAFNLKTQLGYAMPNGMHLNAYYHFKDKENDNNSFADTAKPTNGPVVITNEYAQKADDTFHAAGFSLNLSPSETLTASLGLDWVQNDFDTYFFGTNRRRFETPIVFDPRGVSNFKVDTWSVSFNGEYQANERAKLSAGYTWSKSDGNLRTSGLQATGTPAESQNDKIYHTVHSLILGVDYALKKNTNLRVGYAFDKYEDKTYGDLSGDVHTLMLGLALKL